MPFFARPSVRVIRQIFLSVFPTCDLQSALANRPAVEATMIGPDEYASVQINNGPSERVKGPVTITINRD